jgi:hypothetical protein
MIASHLVFCISTGRGRDTPAPETQEPVIAPALHMSAQEPQSVHASGSIAYMSAASMLIASIGHSSMHSPQHVHASIKILYAIHIP